MDSLLEKHILIAGKKQLADLVIKNAKIINVFTKEVMEADVAICDGVIVCLLYTSPSPRDGLLSRMPSSA